MIMGTLALFQFWKNIRGSDISKLREERGDNAAPGGAPSWSFHGSERRRRPSASVCGNLLGFADESRIPGRRFREARRRPRVQSKLESPHKD
jgi:hypothetical protein